jgi:hypothetical protein
MKKYGIVIFLVFVMLKTYAQDYLISFAGAGDTTEINTVRVDNLTSGATVSLNGGDILHLKATLGIETQDIDNGTLQLYPNPMAEQSMLTFLTPGNDIAIISIVDLSGKIIHQISTILSAGTHQYRISGLSPGMYFVKVTCRNYNYSTKLISQNNLQSVTGIEYVSSAKNSTSNPLKSISTTIDMPYTNGDQLIFTGISGIYTTVVPDVPASNKTITFNFATCTDDDNNNYAIVEIGTQTWMEKNLNIGTMIGSSLQTNNNIIEKYCYND